MGTHVRGQGQTRRLGLFGTRGVVGRCRDFASRALADWGWTPAAGEAASRADDVLLVVSELVTNACLHAGGPTELVLRHTSEGVRIEVADRNPQPPEPRAREVRLPGGHGLLVLERLADSWGSTPLGEGKVVWANLGPAPHAPHVNGAGTRPGTPGSD
ncbi:ATP-binding protein [Streptomyces sp. NPDC056500]|uniref:ATP-binding protein n=1 Tax=Streptomyces sp. NPDC056500 TaxID=3345840 RepID=UPI0036C04E4C